MKFQVKYSYILLFALLVCTPMLAQEEDGGGMGYGYTSVVYDPSSGTVTAYSETDVDPAFVGSYNPAVAIFVSNSSGQDAPGQTCTNRGANAGSVNNTLDWASVTCTFKASSNTDTYTATGIHSLVAIIIARRIVCQYCGGGYQYYYNDIDGFSSLSPYELYEPFGTEYAPAFQSTTTTIQHIALGRTYDSAMNVSPMTCHDVRDQMIKEYNITYKAGFHPSCNDFAWILSWTYPGSFTFEQLTPDQSTGYGQYAVLQSYMATGLRQIFGLLGAAPEINSGYRNPAAESQAATDNGTHYVSSSRHMAGDAVDLATGNNANTYRLQAAAAHDKSVTACVEPSLLSSFSHTHVDWRTHSNPGNFYYASRACPPGW